MLKLSTSWGPSVNHYWGQRGKCRFITKKGLDYRSQVEILFRQSGHKGFGDARCSIEIEACPPDRRERDLDNLLKGICDSLAKAGVVNSDNQFRKFLIYDGPLVKKIGKVNITITTIT